MKRFGYIGKDNALRNIFQKDTSYPILRALEVWDNEGKVFLRKADIFKKRILLPESTPTHADTSMDALAISMTEKGCVDLAYMPELTGRPMTISIP